MMKTIKEQNKINGILLINKSQGMTSNAALQKIKRLFGAKKVGHTGSLDPLATGMLPLCFGEATKICQYLLDADKCYETCGLLGIKTNTSDSTGEEISRVDNFHIDEMQLIEALSLYRGEIKQVPSMFSALKHQGTPLYRLARKGIEIERKARDILISDLQLLAFDGTHFSLKVNCSKGTYIRNLVEDIGDTLQVGAHLIQLHRAYTSGFEEYTMYSLEELQAMSQDERLQCLIPMDKVLDYLPKMTLKPEEVVHIRQGRVLEMGLIGLGSGQVRLYDEAQQFIGLGEQQLDGFLKAKRLLSFDDKFNKQV